LAYLSSKSVTSRIFKALWRKEKTGHFNTVIKQMKNKGVRYREFVEVLAEAERLLKTERLEENCLFRR